MAPGGADKVVIVGGGLAGLFAALRLSPTPVAIVTPKPLGEGASSAWAQAGIAAAVGAGDSPEKHAVDTIKAGAGICDEAVVRSIVAEAPARIEDLLRLGVPFDTDRNGALKLSREAAHGEHRIVGVKGDRAGLSIMGALIRAVRGTPTIDIHEHVAALDLALADDRVQGIYCRRTDRKAGPPFLLPARAVVLATGGIGHLYAVTTNPAEARGEGLGMAARAGALIADAEFVQFHPTALDIGRSPAPLATEALRGAGAWLVNGKGLRFMEGEHPDAELAPRDIVATAVAREIQARRGAFLDCRHLPALRVSKGFPTFAGTCKAAGLDPSRDLIPIAPAAHYHMGGVATDLRGRTSLDGLWAIGEVASTGLHGANRLASNSLLEAVVMAARAAEDIGASSLGPRRPPLAEAGAYVPPPELSAPSLRLLQEDMSSLAGTSRSSAGLRDLWDEPKKLWYARSGHTRGPRRFGNAETAALLIVVAAYLRTETRGSHRRSDHPAPDASQARRSFFTLAQARDSVSNVKHREHLDETRAAH